MSEQGEQARAAAKPRKVMEGPPPAEMPAAWELADLSSVQAIAAGTADPEQQRRGLKWIIEKACDTYGLGWHPESDHKSSFCAGRRFGGMQIVKAVNINVAALRKSEQ